MQGYDAVVVGSGHNALVAAALLARAGWGVLVIEGNDRPGGLVRTDELTLPGYLHDSYASAHPMFVGSPVYAELAPELGLTYLNSRYPTGVCLPDGEAMVVSTDLDESIDEANRLSPGDGDALAVLLKEFEPAIGPVFRLLSADLTSAESALIVQNLLQTADGGFSSFAHMFTQSARELLRSRFRSPVVQALFAPWAMHLGRTIEEDNSGTWIVLLLHALMLAGMPTPEGGSEQLPAALVAMIERSGGSVQCGQWVEQVLVENGRAVGVITSDRQFVRAKRSVIASVNHDQLYLKLLSRQLGVVPPTLLRRASQYCYGRGVVQVHLALSEPPTYLDDRLARVAEPHLTGGLEAVSRATLEAQRGLLPAEPTIAWDVPSALDRSRCPEGRAVVRIQLLEVPARVRGDAAGKIRVTSDGWTDAVKEAFADRVIDQAAQYVPNLYSAILARHVIGPRELAAFNPNCGPGDPFGGSHELARGYTFSPPPSQPSHHTAVPNLFLVGAAAWPGHGVNGGSGYIVAKELLR